MGWSLHILASKNSSWELPLICQSDANPLPHLPCCRIETETYVWCCMNIGSIAAIALKLEVEIKAIATKVKLSPTFNTLRIICKYYFL